MEAYFPIVSKQVTRKKAPQNEETRNFGNVLSKKRDSDPLPLLSALTDQLLDTLSDTSNPITHSNIADRTDHVVAFATGHQVGEGRGKQRRYMLDRTEKLSAQRETTNHDAGILKDTKIYINGYLEATTDIEMKKIITQAGGQIVGTASQCTHILTSRSLSASKTHRLLNQHSRHKKHVVRPEWVMDSIAAGKRRPERSYHLVNTSASSSLQHFLES
ncbi:hypothetical protein BYT27DRAFT_7293386 [Phlegmacium glaucopus]|nr:hypothetical protein BYT27DRAFT_7293386 [Phlegmacium glaucopus]